MDPTIGRLLVILAIFLGCCAKTLAPILRKKKLIDLFQMDFLWLFTAGGAFISSWVTILLAIPTDMALEFQIMTAFLISFGYNGIFNEVVKWKEVADYIRTGEKPST